MINPIAIFNLLKSKLSPKNKLSGDIIPTPSQYLIDFVGGGDYMQIGEEFLKYIVELGGLKPDDTLLDLGSGFGRMAIPLTRYLSRKGGYVGLDVSKECIDWGTAHITSLFPNFKFKCIDVWNKTYNPEGKVKGSEYKMPFGSDCFDFIFLTSVFTHMIADEMENYLSEISRVLKPTRACLITFFLLNQDSTDHIAQGDSTFQFNYQIDRCKTERLESPQDVVGYEESYLKELMKKYGLDIISTQYGSWCGRKDFLSFQDIVILRKNDNSI
jgi:ubiquinone/menaquinone biosynthesis C-methylase UbiE